MKLSDMLDVRTLMTFAVISSFACVLCYKQNVRAIELNANN